MKKRENAECAGEKKTGEHVLKAYNYTGQEQEADMIMNGEGNRIE